MFPHVVLFPASTWPIKTMFMCGRGSGSLTAPAGLATASSVSAEAASSDSAGELRTSFFGAARLGLPVFNGLVCGSAAVDAAGGDVAAGAGAAGASFSTTTGAALLFSLGEFEGEVVLSALAAGLGLCLVVCASLAALFFGVGSTSDTSSSQLSSSSFTFGSSVFGPVSRQ